MKFLTIEELPQCTTISVNEAAHVANIGRSTAYVVAKTGDFFETVMIKGRRRVLAKPLYLKLMGTALPTNNG